MLKFKELLEELQNLKISQKSLDWQEDLPEDIWNKYFKESEGPIEDGLDIDTHRWYELSTQVYKFNDRYLGVRSITNMFSESSEPDDIGYIIEFFEMKPIETITYVKI